MKYKVAVATSDGKTVDSHFGHAQSFLIYEVDEESGAFEDIEERDVTSACSGGECGGKPAESAEAETAGCGGHNGAGTGSSPMDEIAKALSDVDYVLVARIGPHAIRALAKYNVTAYDIVLPIDEAIAKINDFRRKIKERKQNYKTN
ncbi:NifB/NifX family molybdenum-iron cluster-binding protein [uncultured Treponema sp.]|uniref:NifB/NifX family molybdenum-iron cluster-binding protein n=1 Tax=uncultured Treponema sp. TaxID=162155 RepID=UPI0025E3ACD5|nr:NifB/NifX family molybdenum-iron cluster-binding protein [uncultured Treponema sp.]